MITNDEIQLSKMSYTDKDFPSLYTDLLDLSKQLTNKWDPSTSNESDPGVVLLKAAAFIADHSNYNIDKNVLENFLPSATQEESVRNLMEINGYNPEYYISATGSMNLSYKSSETATSGDNFKPFSIPAFTLQISDEDNGKVYTQKDSVSISIEGLSVPCDFIEGTINTLSANGSDNIILDNLDSDNRIYFPIKQVAQNGIYIKNTDASDNDFWEKVDYLQVQDLNTKKYKVGYDSTKGLPYIEFPTDIANIIGSGLNIRYIVTSGLSGNIGANTLNTIVSPEQIPISTEITILCKDFSVNNPSAITNGKNPETINDMYKSFKKVVGTFNTLVTCRDYSNAISNLTDSTSNQNLVGNNVVTDLNNDYNNAQRVVCFDEYGLYYDNISAVKGISRYKFVEYQAGATGNPGEIRYNPNATTVSKFELFNNGYWSEISAITYEDFMSATEAMNRFDLCLYALNMYSSAQYSELYPYQALNDSFTPISNALTSEIKTLLAENNKCISHNFRDNYSGDIICFKNYLPLNVTITPYSKVTKIEKYEILQSIYKAISEKFNSRQVDFGEEISWDDVYDTILNSDSRIKNVRLEDFEYNTVALVKTGDTTEEKPLNTNSDLVKRLIAKNVLAGRVCLFDFSEEFNYNYGELIPESGSGTTDNEYSDVTDVTTSVDISLDLNSTEVNAEATDIYDIKLDYEDVETSGGNIVLKLCHNPDLQPTAAEDIAINGMSSYNFYDEKYVLRVYKISEESSQAPLIWLNEFTCGPDRHFTLTNNTNSTIVLHYTGAVDPAQSTQVGKGDIYVNNYIEKINYGSGNLALNEYELAESEYVTIESPNHYSDFIYPAYTYYRYSGVDDPENDFIPSNIEYTLKGDETLTLVWTSDKVTEHEIYKSGDIIKTNFNLYANEYDDGSRIITKKYIDTVTGSEVSVDCKVLAASEQICHRVLLKTVLKSVDVPCYWIRNNTGNVLFSNSPKEEEIILNTGEYFFYSNSTLDIMTILGPGTKLKRTDNYTWSNPNPISAESINTYGLASNPKWVHRDFSQCNFEIQEMSVITLSQGDTISLLDCTSTATSITNKWEIFNTKIRYTIDGVAKELTKDDYYIRSRYDLKTDNKSITLNETTSSVQKITFKYNSSTVVIEPDPISGIAEVGFNTDINLTGGENININNLAVDHLNVKQYDWDPVKYLKTKFTELNDDDQITTGNDFYKYNKVKFTTVELTEIVTNLRVLYGSSQYKYYKQAYPTGTKIYTKATFSRLDPTTYTEVDYEKSTAYSIVLEDEGHVILPLQYHKKYYDETTTLEVVDSNNYVIPMLFLDSTGSSSISNIISVSVNGEYAFEIKELNKVVTSPTVWPKDFVLYLYELVLAESSESSESIPEINTNIEIDISVSANTNGGTVTIYQPEVFTGINSNLNTRYSYSDIIDEINDIVANSTNPDIRPYLINKPENSMAIQNENFEDPNIFWDKNNVANIVTIGQIDLENSDIDISKSMRNY